MPHIQVEYHFVTNICCGSFFSANKFCEKVQRARDTHQNIPLYTDVWPGQWLRPLECPYSAATSFYGFHMLIKSNVYMVRCTLYISCVGLWVFIYVFFYLSLFHFVCKMEHNLFTYMVKLWDVEFVYMYVYVLWVSNDKKKIMTTTIRQGRFIGVLFSLNCIWDGD